MGSLNSVRLSGNCKSSIVKGHEIRGCGPVEKITHDFPRGKKENEKACPDMVRSFSPGIRRQELQNTKLNCKPLKATKFSEIPSGVM